MNLLDTASLVVTPNGYKASKLYSIIPSDGTGDMTFARTGDTATRVNSSGLIETVLANKPRLDYLGSTCPKLLLEPQRTNLQIYSEQINNATYTKQDLTVVTNDAVAADGTTTADKLYPTTSGSSRQFFSAFAISTATVYTTSLFAKAGGKNWFRMLGINGSGNASFNLADGTVTTVSGGFTATINPYGNGWYRCTLTGTSSSTLGYLGAILINSSTDSSITANGTDGVYFWGLQVEAGAYATSYIPTTTASVTRNAETCYKASATALIGQTEGTAYINFIYNSTGSACVTIALNDTTNDNRIQFEIGSAGSGILYLFSAGTGYVTLSTGSFVANTEYKIAIKYKLNEVSLFKNGIKYGPDITATMPTSLTRIELGSELLSSFNNYKIKSASLWKTSLTDQELITLTTL